MPNGQVMVSFARVRGTILKHFKDFGKNKWFTTVVIPTIVQLLRRIKNLQEKLEPSEHVEVSNAADELRGFVEDAVAVHKVMRDAVQGQNRLKLVDIVSRVDGIAKYLGVANIALGPEIKIVLS